MMACSSAHPERARTATLRLVAFDPASAAEDKAEADREARMSFAAAGVINVPPRLPLSASQTMPRSRAPQFRTNV